MIKLGVVLSRNLCLINHLKVFFTSESLRWKVSKFKVVCAQFLSKFLLIFLFILRLYDSKYARNDSWLDTIKIMHVFSTLLKSEFLSFSTIIFIIEQKLIKRLQKPNILFNSSEKLLVSAYWTMQGQNQKKINQNLDKKWAKTTLNFDTFYLRLSYVWFMSYSTCWNYRWTWNLCFLLTNLFISVLKTDKKTAKPNLLLNLLDKLLFSACIESYRLRIKRILIKIWTKNEQKQLWILTLFIWGCWGWVKSKKFQMVDQA